MRGIGSQPALIRTKVIDRADGSYMCEFRPWMTGTFTTSITLDGEHIEGSPFSVRVITLRPDPAQCVVRGDALHNAVARSPQYFEVLFVDAIGHTVRALGASRPPATIDVGDGSYELNWCCEVSGLFNPLDVLIDGAVVVGSPISLEVRAAKADVTHFIASGEGLSKAICGVKAKIRIRAADRFDNLAKPDVTTVFGLYLVTSKAQPSDKKKEKSFEKKDEHAGSADVKKPKQPQLFPDLSPEAQAAANEARKRTAQQQVASATSLPFEGAWVGGLYEIKYVAQEAGTLELHLWCTQDGAKEPLPGSPFCVQVGEGPASASGSYVREAEASKHGSGFVAGDHVTLRPQLRDQFQNASSAAEGQLTAVLESPDGTEAVLEPPKLRSGLGSYELTLEPAAAGPHRVHIKLNGDNITGSPVAFHIAPAAPHSANCYLSREDNEPIPVNTQCDILLTTHDKYGNQLDRGGVRVDAKALGAAVSACTVTDHKDGTYTIRLSAGAKGEVKVTARVDSVEIKTLSVFFVKAEAEAMPYTAEQASEAAEGLDGEAAELLESAAADEAAASAESAAGGSRQKAAKPEGKEKPKSPKKRGSVSTPPAPEAAAAAAPAEAPAAAPAPSEAAEAAAAPVEVATAPSPEKAKAKKSSRRSSTKKGKS